MQEQADQRWAHYWKISSVRDRKDTDTGFDSTKKHRSYQQVVFLEESLQNTVQKAKAGQMAHADKDIQTFYKKKQQLKIQNCI